MKNTTKKFMKFVVGILVVLLIAVAVVVPVSADSKGTDVKLTMYNLTITVDQTIAGWGYVLSDNQGTTHHTLITTDVLGKGTGIQVGVLDMTSGWYLKVDENSYCSTSVSGNIVTISNVIGNASVTISAHNDTMFTVTFDTDGGSEAPQSQSVKYGGKVTKPSDPTKTGYTFDGWYYGSSKWNFNNDVVTSDMTLKAHWTPITYKVHFDANTGVGSMTDQEFTYDVAQNLSANLFTKTGYTFSGWSETASGSVKYADKAEVKNLTTTPDDMVTLYAKWNKNTYTVTFDTDGGSEAPQSQSVEYGGKVTKPLNPTKTGYTFDGWYNGSSKWNFNNDVVTSDMTLKAHWTPITYEVHFDANGGTGNMNNQEFTYDEAQNLTANAFTRTGYAFAGWSETASGSVKYADKAEVKNLSSEAGSTVTLYAVWTANTYYVHFNGNGATSGSMNNQTFTYDKAQTLTANAFSKTGYTFAGWSETASGQVVYADKAEVVNLTSEAGGMVTLYAVWTANTYYVHFDGNDATSGSMSDQTFTYDKSQTLTANGFSRTGYTFSGWSETASGSVKYADKAEVKNLTTTPDATVTLYAKWNKNTYTVTFDTDGGSPKPVAQSVEYGGKVTKPSDPTKTGYTFDGWYNGSSKWDFNTDVVTANLTLTAHWTPVTYKVHFDAGSGEGAQMADQEFKYDEKKQLTLNTYTKTGYTFKNWVDENGTEYQDGQFVEKLSSEQGAVVELTAQWEPITYEVHFDANGGTGNMNNQEFTYDEAQNLTANAFTRTGYAFAGWSTTSGGQVVYADKAEVKNLTTVAGAKVNLFAVWTANTYYVHFNANGGTGSMNNQQFTYGEAQNLSLNGFTAPDGKHFAGWSKTASGEVKYTDGQSVKNLTAVAGATVDLYAVWSVKPKEYWKVSFDANGGSGSMADISVEKGLPVTVPENEFTAPEGKEFKEWLVQGTTVVLHPGDMYIPTADTVLVAQWKSLEYWTLTFNANGGSGTMDPVSVVKGGSVYLPSNGFKAPSKSVFNGWLIEGTKYAAGEKYTPVSDVTVYATWKSSGTGGSGSSAVSWCLVQFKPFNGTEIEDQYLREGSLVQRPEDPVNVGFVFGGWYTEEGKEWNFATDRVYYSMTLYAKWIYQDTPVTPVEPVTPVQPVATPVGVAGILAGLGAAAVLLRRK